MGKKTGRSTPRSPTVLFIFFICMVQYTEIANAFVWCQYYVPNNPLNFIKQCPSTCCPLTKATRENTTCCTVQPVVEVVTTTTTRTIFGYSWWVLLLCAISIFIGLCVFFQMFKRRHAFKHWKHFNSITNPAAAFTIPTDDSKMAQACHYTVRNDVIVLEEYPPSYTTFEPEPSPASPPPLYTSADLPTNKISE
ncbi:unnamed protein product [Adineta steineri]|uniref:Uncharacterized protein n=1 Tax=Adineta steineri TaxID=433720 RepID=A0A818RC70_9BILA|nr:unnamed protein product [Adineta steineri]CAF0796234.1 unnamed protein product [Adineta steineri]CAF3512225.1 unnamed protein product [Adineta steineri]CAF3654599.1 unnamed protein product [Adineta steineri]